MIFFPAPKKPMSTFRANSYGECRGTVRARSSPQINKRPPDAGRCIETVSRRGKNVRAEESSECHVRPNRAWRFFLDRRRAPASAGDQQGTPGTTRLRDGAPKPVATSTILNCSTQEEIILIILFIV